MHCARLNHNPVARSARFMTLFVLHSWRTKSVMKRLLGEGDRCKQRRLDRVTEGRCPAPALRSPGCHRGTSPTRAQTCARGFPTPRGAGGSLFPVRHNFCLTPTARGSLAASSSLLDQMAAAADMPRRPQTQKQQSRALVHLVQ